jgi:hypothetical protein
MSTGGGPSTAAPEVSPEQVQQIIAGLQGTRKPKIKEPEVFDGERAKLRRWLAQIKIYFRAVGWATEHDEEKLLYTISLLRGSAGTWITPYAEERLAPPWTTWDEFVEALRVQFGVTDAKGEARIKLKNLKQGSRSVTEYWSEFRLIASEAELDDSTSEEWLLTGMSRELQDAWGADSDEFEGTEELARWAIRKETKLATVRHIQKRSNSSSPTTNTSRNQDGTFRPTSTPRTTGDPMDLDATRRRPNFGLSRNEFQRRLRGTLCLACGKPGHRARECRSPRDNKDYTDTKQGVSQGRQGPWQSRPKIKEMEIREEPEQSGNDDSSQ